MTTYAPHVPIGNDGISDSEFSDTIENLLTPAEPGEVDPQRIASSYEAHAVDLEQDGLNLLEGVWGDRIKDLITATTSDLRTTLQARVDNAEDDAASARAAVAGYRAEIDALKRDARARDQALANMQRDLASLRATVTTLTTRLRSAQPQLATNGASPQITNQYVPPPQTIMRPQLQNPQVRSWSFDA